MRLTGRRKTLALALVGVLVGAGVVGGFRVWTHPRVLEDQGASSLLLDPRPLGDGFPVHQGVATGRPGTDEDVVLASVRPRWSVNTADAEVRFHVCTERAQSDGGSLRLGTEGPEFEPRDLCTAYRPVRPGTRLHLAGRGPGGDYVVATVVPRRAGRAVLETVDVTYRRDGRHLRQHGTQRLRQHFVVRVTRGD